MKFARFCAIMRDPVQQNKHQHFPFRLKQWDKMCQHEKHLTRFLKSQMHTPEWHQSWEQSVTGTVNERFPPTAGGTG